MNKIKYFKFCQIIKFIIKKINLNKRMNKNNPMQNGEKITEYIVLTDSDEENKEKIHLEKEEDYSNPFEEEESSSNLSYRNFNKKIKKEYYHENPRYNIEGMQEPKIKLTFKESMDNLKNNFRKLFNKKNNNKNEDITIFKNETFRKAFITNQNMQLIFKFTDIIREIYENQLQIKIVEKICDINKIIDIYINKIKKLIKHRRIIVKNHNNLIYVIGCDIYINKIETQAKEFIVKKRTETFKGNNKIITSDDDCYIMEINSNKKKKQTFFDPGDVTSALIILEQNLIKDAVFK